MYNFFLSYKKNNFFFCCSITPLFVCMIKKNYVLDFILEN